MKKLQTFFKNSELVYLKTKIKTNVLPGRALWSTSLIITIIFLVFIYSIILEYQFCQINQCNLILSNHQKI